jgi:hypothetical protein
LSRFFWNFQMVFLNFSKFGFHRARGPFEVSDFCSCYTHTIASAIHNTKSSDGSSCFWNFVLLFILLRQYIIIYFLYGIYNV